jgi:hypothetical protein
MVDAGSAPGKHLKGASLMTKKRVMTRRMNVLLFASL